MRKLAFLGLLLVLSTGCGRGWLPGLFRGAPCGGRCGITGNSLPAAPIHTDAGCTDCGSNSASYGSYESGVITDGYSSGVVSDGYYGGGVVSDGYYGGGTVLGETVVGGAPITNGAITSPPMSAVPATP